MLLLLIISMGFYVAGLNRRLEKLEHCLGYAIVTDGTLVRVPEGCLKK